ncbi:MAG TPA: hypothetical protein VMZ71_13760 [Gemmataceae bacterium]|nr:hypothetical protein [Gemmataceae bacterium]
MTETEWLDLDSTHVSQMLGHMGTKASMRKLRLLACICARRLWDDMSDASKRSIEVAERFADGHATLAELRAAAVPHTTPVRADVVASHAGAATTQYRSRAAYALSTAGRTPGARTSWCSRTAATRTASTSAGAG